MASGLIFFINCFVTLVSILDPFGGAASLLALTPEMDQEGRAKVAARTARTVLGILLLFAVAGGAVFMAFGISMSALTTAGGIILCTMAIKMIQGEDIIARKIPAQNEPDSSGPEDVAIIPLAIPLMAGPAAISSVTVFAHRAEGVAEYILLLAAILSSALACWLILARSHRISTVLGLNGMKIMVRVMGLILMAMGVEFILSGVKYYFS